MWWRVVGLVFIVPFAFPVSIGHLKYDFRLALGTKHSQLEMFPRYRLSFVKIQAFFVKI